MGIVIGGTEAEPLLLEGHEHLGKVYASYITPINLITGRIESLTGKRVLVDIIDLDKLKSEEVEFVS